MRAEPGYGAERAEGGGSGGAWLPHDAGGGREADTVLHRAPGRRHIPCVTRFHALDCREVNERSRQNSQTGYKCQEARAIIHLLSIVLWASINLLFTITLFG